MRAVHIVIAAIVVLALPLVGLGVVALLPERDRGPARTPEELARTVYDAEIARELLIARVDDLEAGATEGQGLSERVASLEGQVTALSNEITELRRELAAVPSGGGYAPGSPDTDGTTGRDVVPVSLDICNTEEFIIPERARDTGLTTPSSSDMVRILGRPRDSIDQTCRPMTNPRLKDMLRTEQVGPVRVTMLEPAMESFKRVMARIEAAEPALHAKLGTAGGLCVRATRGSSSFSSHSFGLAIDLKIDGELDAFRDGATQCALIFVADFFLEEGWVWGAHWRSVEDSMHFQVSEEKLEEWSAEGRF